jgi:hypothetical protein
MLLTMPNKEANANPVKAICATVSPIIVKRLMTMNVPMRGQIIAISTPAIIARCMNG